MAKSVVPGPCKRARWRPSLRDRRDRRVLLGCEVFALEQLQYFRTILSADPYSAVNVDNVACQERPVCGIMSFPIRHLFTFGLIAWQEGENAADAISASPFLTSMPKLGCRVHCSFLHSGCRVSTMPKADLQQHRVRVQERQSCGYKRRVPHRVVWNVNLCMTHIYGRTQNEITKSEARVQVPEHRARCGAQSLCITFSAPLYLRFGRASTIHIECLSLFSFLALPPPLSLSSSQPVSLHLSISQSKKYLHWPALVSPARSIHHLCLVQ